MNPLVSVCICAFNHDRFIAQAIESVLSQEIDGPIEVLIGEDDSEDETRSTVKDYAQRYPDKIRLFLNDRENVITIAGHATGRWNLTNLLRNARGEYIAVLDGDDFWTDAGKLQRQVYFLEQNPDYAFCFHNVECVKENGDSMNILYCSKDIEEGEVPQNKLFSRCITQFGSALFRAAAVQPPPMAMNVRSYDWFLYIHASESGKIHYTSDVSSAYRVHQNGVWQGMSQLDMIKGEIISLEAINEHFRFKFDQPISAQIEKLKIEVSVRNAVDEEISSKNEELEFLRSQLAARTADLDATQTELSGIRKSKAYKLYSRFQALKRKLIRH